jgi:UDP-3-O-[3-hydroxymyristoyl] N-acetylglucosamine deacetylase
VTCCRRKQRTLQRPVTYSGIGIHTGQIVTMRFVPAAEDNGVLFRRVDLPGEPVVPATVDYVCDTARSTSIGIDKVCIHTVEHVLAALSAMEIDNVIVEVSNVEPPIGNGSSDIFIEMIETAQFLEQEAFRPIVALQEVVYHSEGDIHLVALPSEKFQISYTLSYPDTPALAAQYYSFELTAEGFKREIAPCRTFSLYREIAPLIERGLIKGGSLDNAVVINDNAILSKGGLFFPNEMVRHKILDMVGDLSLIAKSFTAHIIAVRSGHASNVAIAKKILKSITSETYR